MKYIRTKEGRLINVSNMTECETDDDYNEGKRIFDGYEDSDGTYYPVEDILKQSDTIEELCDAVVVVYPNGDYDNHQCYDYENFYEVLQRCLWVYKSDYKDHEIYGAILVKGEHGEPILKPAAKMNEKGELELL